MKEIPLPECVQVLVDHQRQVDEDGTEIGVSRQALCETVDLVRGMQRQIAALQPLVKDSIEECRRAGDMSWEEATS